MVYHYKGPESTWFFLGLPITEGFLRGTSLHGSQACFNGTWFIVLEVSSVQRRCSPPNTVAGADVRYREHLCLSVALFLDSPARISWVSCRIHVWILSESDKYFPCLLQRKNYTILLPLKTPKNTFFFFLYTKSPKIWDLCAYVLYLEMKSLLHLPPKHLLFSLL